MNQWEKKATEFFEEYAKPTNGGRDKRGNMTIQCMKDCADFLVGRGVFESKEEIAIQAMRDYAIYLPAMLFDEAAK